MKFISPIFFLFLLCISASAQVAFEQNVVIDNTFGSVYPKDISVADIDGDGFKDILVAGQGATQWVRSTNGQGGFERGISFFADFIDSDLIKAADFDGDGDMDVVIYARGRGNMHEVLYTENLDGLGAFSEPIAIANTGSTFRLNLQLLDIDNDGDVDIAYSSNEKIAWLENTDGKATFKNHDLLGRNDGFYASDLNGDQRIDFVADFGYDLKAYTFNEDGTLTFMQTVNTFSLNNDHKVADLDGDGDNDIVTLFENGRTRQVHWYEKIDTLNAFGSRRILLELPSYTNGPSGDRLGLEIADMDQDTILDIVIFESRSNGMSWYKNLGNDTFDIEQIISNQIATISSTTIADLDDDGANDVLFTDQVLSEYSWYKNQTKGEFGNPRRISSYAYFPNHVDYGDIDGDGDLDLVSSSHGDNKIAWYENTNTLGDFSNIQQLISTDNENPYNVFSLDLDGDKDLDVLAYNYLDSSTDEYQLLWFENDGTGTFPVQHTIETIEEEIIEINYADVDQDGDLDIISGQERSVLALHLNNGDGTFAPKVIFSEPGFSYLLDLKVADMDGDMDLDVLASYNNNEIIWHENKDGDLTTKHVIVEQMHYPRAIFAVDIDGDMDMDVLFANQFRDEVGYFLNEDGKGTFGPKVITSEVPQNPRVIYSLDMDQDGDMDMITSSSEGQKFIWFPNDGAGNFGDAVEITSLIGTINHLTAADLNNDRNIDLITTSWDDDKVAWFKNLGVPFTNVFTGMVRLDANADGCDSLDTAAPNVLMQTDNGINTFSTFTKPDGSYRFQANERAFTTTIAAALPNYYVSNPASYGFDFTGLNDSIFEADFCIEASQEVNDLQVVIYPDRDEPRPGFETSYRLVFKNNGTQPHSGAIDFQFDGSKLQLLSTSENVLAQTSNSLTFDYVDLIPFETRYIDLVFRVYPPPTNGRGDILQTLANISPTANDLNDRDNTFELSQIVVNAFDPNDIRVLEGETINIEEADNHLHYIIRFQNTGTASAINVRVNNRLDEELDWSSLQLESLSHPGIVEIRDGNDVDFVFNNINLPDSTTNEPASHGFICYKIRPKEGVVIGDIFSNRADIYFDFNAPILTNTVHTEIITQVSVEDIASRGSNCFPNPVQNILTVESNYQIHSIRIYDLHGRLFNMVRPNNKMHLMDVSTLVGGLYFMKISGKDQLETLKFLKK
ncbi:MAG: T9SS type A sorting domain-containing protein [Bacteroidota bacterium]